MFYYFLRVLKIFKSARPISAFKIIDLSGTPENKDSKVIFQVSGKVSTAAEKPANLINDLMTIEGFTKEDSHLIYNLSVREKNSATLKILSILFTSTPVQFEVEDLDCQYTLLLTAEEIASSNQMLESFSPNDLGIIYFQLFKENEEKQKAAKQFLCQSDNEKNIYLFKNTRPHE